MEIRENILHAETCSGSSTEWNHVFAQLVLVRSEPSVWLEGAGFGEVGWVIVEHDGGHAYGRLKKVPRVLISAGVVAVVTLLGMSQTYVLWDRPFLVLQVDVWRNSL